MMVSFIDENRDEFGVEPICAQLPIAPSGYYAAKSRPPSARARRDAVLVPQLVALWQANYRVYGARKLWKAARRAGIDVGRDQVARLMRLAGIEGTHRCRRVRTTSATPRRRSSRRPTLPDKPTTHWLETNKPSLHKTQCDSLGELCWVQPITNLSVRFLRSAAPR